MLAPAMTQKAKAFTGAIPVRDDADMIQRPEPQAVDGKTPAADGAGNLRKSVKRCLGTFADAKDPGFSPKRPKQPNRLLPAHGQAR